MSKKKDTGYRVAVSGAKGILRILLYALIIIAIIYAGRRRILSDMRYLTRFRWRQRAGQDITVVVKEEDSVKEIARNLEKKGVITDDQVFRIQERISDYHNKIRPGTYILNTEQTTEEILAILSQENTEGQPVILNQEEGEAEDKGGEKS